MLVLHRGRSIISCDVAGTRSRVYSVDSFETTVGGHPRTGPRPGDVFTSSKSREQLICIDNSFRICTDGKREYTVIALTNKGELQLSPPSRVTVQGTRADLDSFQAITPAMVTQKLERHYQRVLEHLSQTPLPKTADAVRPRSSAQVPPHPSPAPRRTGLHQDESVEP